MPPRAPTRVPRKAEVCPRSMSVWEQVSRRRTVQRMDERMDICEGMDEDTGERNTMHEGKDKDMGKDKDKGGMMDDGTDD